MRVGRIAFLVAAGCWYLVSSSAIYAQDAIAPQDYTGTWVMMLGERVFIVLTLEESNGHFTGTLRRTEQFQTSDGTSFSHVGGSVRTQPIVSGTREKNHLHFVAADSNDNAAGEEFDMTLTGGEQASVKRADVPIDGFTFKRNREAVPPPVATDWDPQRLYSKMGDQPKVPSAEMRKIYEEDQKPRQNPADASDEEWTLIGQQDGERRNQTRALLAAGKLQTAADFQEAAFIFQHGSTPDDYLLAHTLSMVAVAQGDVSALWIATATMDRYLQSIGRPQIYGTQFRNQFKTNPDNAATQEPYDRDLISDLLRRQLQVPSLAAQQEQLRYWQEQFRAAAAKAK